MRILPVPTSRWLTPEARRQVEVLFEAILPGTATSPGATDAGAADFLDTLLAVDPARFYEVTGWRDTYVTALPALDDVARARYGAGLADLPAQEARDLVAALAAGELAPSELPDGVDQAALFGTLRNHCIEGCFANPRWGGNRDQVMWRWIGYGQPPEHFGGRS
jgi:gluconate 2-dehydrogenase gamma chain